MAVNFIDIKDAAGDKAGGITTLPVLLGPKRSRRLIGAAFWASYLCVAQMLGAPLLLPLAFCVGGVEYWLINRSPYCEAHVLAVYLLSLLSLPFLLR